MADDWLQEQAVASGRRLAATSPLLLDDVGRTIQRRAIVMLSDAIEAVEQFKAPNDCPECQQGKHVNCSRWAIDESTDEVVDCDCAVGGHL